MKIFFALSFSEKDRKKLYETYQDKLKYIDGGRFTEMDNFHMTVTFIGNIEENNLEVYKNILRKFKKPILKLRISKLGYFMKKRYILYYMIEENNLLKTLKENLDKELEFIGFSDQYDEFIPHITIGRNIKGLGEKIYEDEVALELNVESFNLMESVNINGRLVYRSLLGVY